MVRDPSIDRPTPPKISPVDPWEEKGLAEPVGFADRPVVEGRRTRVMHHAAGFYPRIASHVALLLLPLLLLLLPLLPLLLP